MEGLIGVELVGVPRRMRDRDDRSGGVGLNMVCRESFMLRDGILRRKVLVVTGEEEAE